MITIQASDFIEKCRFKDRPISTFGGENIFVGLHYKRKGELIELTANLVQFLPSGHELVEEVGREVTTDEEDALSMACDLEHAGAKRLRELDVEDEGSDPCDFQTALERIFSKADQHAIAAE